jgi:hypothetical protein
MQATTVIGLGLLIGVVGLVVYIMLEGNREVCSFCGKSSCDGERCERRESWEQREAQALAKLAASLEDREDDLPPRMRQYIESL